LSVIILPPSQLKAKQTVGTMATFEQEQGHLHMIKQSVAVGVSWAA